MTSIFLFLRGSYNSCFFCFFLFFCKEVWGRAVCQSPEPENIWSMWMPTAEDVLNQTAWPALWIAVSSPSSESLVLVQGLKNRATTETGMEAGAWTSTVQTSSHHGHRGFYSYSLWGILSSPNGSTRLGTASWPTGLGFYFRPFCREGITDLFSLEHSCFSLHLDLPFLLVLHLLRPYEIFCEGMVFLLRLPLTFREREVTQWAG